MKTKQTELPTKTVSELLDKKRAEDDSQAEGSIQDLFLDQEIKVTNAELSEDNNGKKSIIFITDSAGKERIAYSYGSVVYSDLEEYLVDGLGKDFALACRVSWIVPKNGGKNYLKLDTV